MLGGLLGLMIWGSAAGVGAQGPSAQAAPQVGAVMQPLDTPKEFVLTKSMQAGLAVEPVAIDLGDWVGEKALSAGPMLVVGTSRDIVQAKSSDVFGLLLKWQSAASGGSVAAISLRSGNAEGLRLGLVIGKLPGSALLRLYTDHQPQAVFEISGQRVLQAVQANIDAGDTSEAGRTWWTPMSSGDQVTLEIELPPGTSTQALELSIPHLIHVYENLSLPLEGETTAKYGSQPEQRGDALSCHLDSTCYDAYDTQRRGVARMTHVVALVNGGYQYGLCTGSLLNDRNSTLTPYFITAAHCMSTQTEASSLETDWFYLSSSCGSSSLSSSTRHLYGGAQLLYSSAVPDVTLLRLNDTPPAGAYFLGWSTAIVPTGGSLYGIHHPAGDVQKISFGTMAGRWDCTSALSGTTFSCRSSADGAYYNVKWSQGLTEPGSSGSPLINGTQVVGVLTGGSGAMCPATNTESFYPSLNSVFANLQRWLYPDTDTPVTTPTPTQSRVPVYRFFNKGTGTHFFTASADERDFVIQTYPLLQYEDVAFYASSSQQTGQSGVYRFFNTSSGAHFYTISAGERDFVIDAYPVFNYEGVAWYARQDSSDGAVPIYRFFNSRTGAHFYTINAQERDFVIEAYPVFQYEGVAYNAWKTP